MRVVTKAKRRRHTGSSAVVTRAATQLKPGHFLCSSAEAFFGFFGSYRAKHASSETLMKAASHVGESVRPVWRLRFGKTVIGTTLSLAGGVAHPFMHVRLWWLLVSDRPPIDRSLRPAASRPAFHSHKGYFAQAQRPTRLRADDLRDTTNPQPNPKCVILTPGW